MSQAKGPYHDEFDKRSKRYHGTKEKSDSRGNLLTPNNADMFRLTSIESMYDEVYSQVKHLKKSNSRSRSGVRLVSYDSEDESSLLETDSESEEEPTPPPAMEIGTPLQNYLEYSDTESDGSTSDLFDLPDSISSRESRRDFSELAQFYTPPPIRKKKPEVQRDPNPYRQTCPNAHDLKFDSKHMKVCNICKKSMSSGYSCECDFAMCEDCYEDAHQLTAPDKGTPTTTQSMRKPPKEEPMNTRGKKKRKPKKKRKGKNVPAQKEPEPIPEFLQKGKNLRKKRKGRRKKKAAKAMEVVFAGVETALDEAFEISVDTVQTPPDVTNHSRESSPQPPSAHSMTKYLSGQSDLLHKPLSLSESGTVLKRHTSRGISASYSRPSSNDVPLSQTLINKRPSANSQISFQDLQDMQEQLTELTSKMNLLTSASTAHDEIQLAGAKVPTPMSAMRTSVPVESPPLSSLATNATTRSSSSPNCKTVDGIWEWVGSEGLDRYLAHIGHGWWSRTFISLFGQERLHLRMAERIFTCTRTRSSTKSITNVFQLGEPQEFTNFQGKKIKLCSGSMYKDGVLCMDFRSKHGDSCTKRYVDANGDLVWETDFIGSDKAQTKLKFKLLYSAAQF